MKLDNAQVKYVYFNTSYGAGRQESGLACTASYAFPASQPFTKDLAADAWAYLISTYPGVQRLIDSGKAVYFLSHEAAGMVPENQSKYPKGAYLNFSNHSDPKCTDGHAVYIHEPINS